MPPLPPPLSLPLSIWATSMRLWQESLMLQMTVGLWAMQAAVQMATTPGRDAHDTGEELPPPAENAPV